MSVLAISICPLGGFGQKIILGVNCYIYMGRDTAMYVVECSLVPNLIFCFFKYIPMYIQYINNNILEVPYVVTAFCHRGGSKILERGMVQIKCMY